MRETGRDASIARFEQLYRDQHRRLFGLAWRLTASAPEAEDAVQETFLRALRASGRYQDRERAGAWLSRILVNVVRDGCRRRALAKRRAPEVERSYGDLARGPVDPERAGEASEALQAAVAAIGALPESFRIVLVLRRLDELSTADVALTLGLPEATVRTRLKRARDRLAASTLQGSR